MASKTTDELVNLHSAYVMSGYAYMYSHIEDFRKDFPDHVEEHIVRITKVVDIPNEFDYFAYEFINSFVENGIRYYTLRHTWLRMFPCTFYKSESYTKIYRYIEFALNENILAGLVGMPENLLAELKADIHKHSTVNVDNEINHFKSTKYLDVKTLEDDLTKYVWTVSCIEKVGEEIVFAISKPDKFTHVVITPELIANDFVFVDDLYDEDYDREIAIAGVAIDEIFLTYELLEK
jgi:hypothetical protein